MEMQSEVDFIGPSHYSVGKELKMPFTLLCEDLTVRQQLGPSEIGPLITNFLGPAPNLLISCACTFGSTVLLDWIWDCCANDNSPGWSLTNLVLAGSHYYRWLFVNSLYVAAKRDDLAVGEWLFAHFSGSNVPKEVVEVASVLGHVRFLQLLLEHDSGQQDTGDTADNASDTSNRSVSATKTKVNWGDPLGFLQYVRCQHLEVYRWFYDHQLYRPDFTVDKLIDVALSNGDIALAESLLPPGKSILEYRGAAAHLQFIKQKLDRGDYRQNPRVAVLAIKYATRTAGSLDLVKRIALQNDFSHLESYELFGWRFAMEWACQRGDCVSLSWLLEHEAGYRISTRENLLALMAVAARVGQADVMQFLYDQFGDQVIYHSGRNLLQAVRDGRLNVVAWLVEHFPESEQLPDYCVVNEAARYGRLDVLKYLQSLDPTKIPGLFPAMAELDPSMDTSGGVCVTRCDNYLKLSRHRKGQDIELRTIWRPSDVMDEAAANGRLEVVKWLHLSRPEGCTKAAMDCAAANEHLETVKWLHSNRSEGCTTRAMVGAAENGHLEVLKWLHVNRSEGTTAAAIERALGEGHLRVVYWLRAHYPQFTPIKVSIPSLLPRVFDVLLFLRDHYPSLFTADFARETWLILRPGLDSGIVTWFKEQGLPAF